MRVYFAGKIAKGVEGVGQQDWRAELAASLNVGDELVQMISPENATLDEGDSMAVFGHDCALIQSADLVIVAADQKLGVGTAQEMIIAKYFSKPVLTILPKDTHHRRSNLEMFGTVIADWKHPFIVSTSDRLFESVGDLREFLRQDTFKDAISDVKTIHVIDEAIAHYRSQYEV